jgi:hypothetical protein
MNTDPMPDGWSTSIVLDPRFRARQLRLARVTEAVFSLVGAGFMFAAVWGFTNPGSALRGIDRQAAAGIALLCFNGCMMIAAAGGIRRRLISLVAALEPRGRSSGHACPRH